MNFSAEKNENYSQRDLQLKIYELSWEQFMRDLELRRQDAIRSAQEALSVYKDLLKTEFLKWEKIVYFFLNDWQIFPYNFWTN